MAAEGNALPVVVGNQVFVTAEPRTLMALNAEDGTILWEREITFVDSQPPSKQERLAKQRKEALLLIEELAGEETKLNILKAKARKSRVNPELTASLSAQSLKVNEMTAKLDRLQKFRPPEALPVVGSASSTPVVYDGAIFAIFGNGVVAKVSFSGELIWARFLGKPMQTMHGYFRGQAASPRIIGDRLIVPLNHLYALSCEDGSTLWKSESYDDFGTPAVVKVGERHVVVTPSGLVVNSADGEVLGRDLAGIFYASPIVAGRVVYFVGSQEDHKMDRHFTALEIIDGAGSAPSVRQLRQKRIDTGSNHSSPLFLNDLVYSIDKSGKLMIYSASEGKLISKEFLDERLPSSSLYYPSPAYAGGHIYITNNDGMTGVFTPGLQSKAVSFNPLKPMRSSLVFVGDRIFARTKESVFCIREKKR